DVAVHRGDAVEAPVRGRAGDRLIELLHLLLGAPQQAFSPLPGLVGRAPYAPERLDHALDRLTADVPLIQHLERALPCFGSLAHWLRDHHKGTKSTKNGRTDNEATENTEVTEKGAFIFSFSWDLLFVSFVSLWWIFR